MEAHWLYKLKQRYLIEIKEIQTTELAEHEDKHKGTLVSFNKALFLECLFV